MKIIIAGAGEVGFHLAKLLAHEGHDIVVIDKDAHRLEYASSHLDVHTVKGNSLSYKTLQDSGIAEAGLLIAVTSVEETNISAAIIGKNLGAQRTIARISNTEFLQEKGAFSLRAVGIDEVIIPESLAAREIQRLLREAALTDTFEFDGGALLLVGVTLSEDSPLLGKSVVEAWPSTEERHFTNVAILRHNETIVPRGNTRFHAYDHAYFITQPQGMDSLVALSGKPRIDIKDVIILGGSKVGVNTAHRLRKKYNLKIIEQNRQKCYELADMFPDVMIINGDGRDVDLLVEEGIEHADAFIAVTGNSEANIISSLVAKHKNISKTIALVENIEYIHLSQSIGIDTLINKKLISANFIFRYVRKGEILSLTSIHGVDAEILEFEVKETSKILEAALKDLSFPPHSLIGGVIRKGVGHAVGGDFHFMPRDRVVMLCQPDAIRQVENLFQ